MQRRQFLKHLGLASASLAVPTIIPARALGREQQPAPSGRTTLGWIGTGSQGTYLLRNFLREDRAQVVALCDVDSSRVQTARGIVEEAYAAASPSGKASPIATYGDFRELLARDDIDAVVIAVPDHWHALAVIHAARAGKHIYVEKPFSLTIPEGRAMVNAITAAGVVCQIGSQQRSSREFQRVVELARSGLLGEIKNVAVGLPYREVPALTKPAANQPVPPEFNYDMWLGPAPYVPYMRERCHWDFRWIFDYSGGQLSDWIGHHYDIAAWALGVSHIGPIAIRKAKARFCVSPVYDTAEEFSFEAHYAGGQKIHLSSDNRTGVRIDGTDGWVWADRGRTEFSSARLARAPIPSDGFSTNSGTTHYANFLDCLATRQDPRCPPEEAHRSASVAHLANIAFRTGRDEIRWEPDDERFHGAPEATALLARAYRGPWQLPV